MLQIKGSHLPRVLALFVAVSSAPLIESGDSLAQSKSVPVYQPKYFPFDSGEKAVYVASWNGLVSVATAEILTTPQVVDGKKFYNVRVEAKSARGLDFIWKMRDTITST